MSSSLCISGASGAMAAKNVKPNARRGRREMRDITVETYSRSGEEVTPVLPNSSVWESGQTAVTLFSSAPVHGDSHATGKSSESSVKHPVASQSSMSEGENLTVSCNSASSSSLEGNC